MEKQKKNRLTNQRHILHSVLCMFLLVSMEEHILAKTNKFRGYVESRYSYLGGISLGTICEQYGSGVMEEFFRSLCSEHLLFNRLVPSFLVPFGRSVRVRATVNATTTHFKLERKIDDIADIVALQRLYFDYRTPHVDFRVGLQSVNWGPALFWRITAPFNPQDVTDPSAEIPGVWGLTSYLSYSDTGGMRFGLLAARDFDGFIGFTRWKQTFGTTQFAATLLYDEIEKRMTFGFDVKGNVEVGFWIDAAFHIPYQSEVLDQEGVSGALAIGIDYSFDVLERLYLAVQLYYNHSGIRDPAMYPFKTVEGIEAIGNQFSQTSQVSGITGIGFSSGGNLGDLYLLLSSQLGILEELSLSSILLTNLRDASSMMGLTLQVQFFDNFTFTLGSYLFVGSEGSEFNIGAIKLPNNIALNIPGYPIEGLAFSPRFVCSGWLRYNF